MASSPKSGTISTLMERFRSGDREAANQLFTVLYPELKRLAASKMAAEGSQHSWQPSLLVHELYLQLSKGKTWTSPPEGSRSEQEQFLLLAGHIMRHLLIDHARLLSRKVVKVDIADFDFANQGSGEATLQEMDDLLERLAVIDPALRSVVEMKVFEGLSVEETASRLQIAPRTVARYWAFSKEWLREQLRLQ